MAGEAALKGVRGRSGVEGGVAWLSSQETKWAGNHTVGCSLIKAKLPREEGHVSWTDTGTLSPGNGNHNVARATVSSGLISGPGPKPKHKLFCRYMC